MGEATADIFVASCLLVAARRLLDEAGPWQEGCRPATAMGTATASARARRIVRCAARAARAGCRRRAAHSAHRRSRADGPRLRDGVLPRWPGRRQAARSVRLRRRDQRHLDARNERYRALAQGARARSRRAGDPDDRRARDRNGGEGRGIRGVSLLDQAVRSRRARPGRVSGRAPLPHRPHEARSAGASGHGPDAGR